MNTESTQNEVIVPEVMPKEAVQIIEETGLEKSTAMQLKSVFNSMFGEADKWIAKAQAINVTDCSQVSEMKKARELRLELRAIRCEAETKRKALKADALLKGKAIDGIANVLKALIEPVETHLQEQEDFAKIVEAKRQQELFAERLRLISAYDPDIYSKGGTDFGTMSQDMFDAMLNGMKMKRESEIAEAKRIEDERIAEQKRQVLIEQERELARQKELKDAQERAEKEAKLRLESERKAKQEREKAEKEAREAKEKAEAESERLRQEATQERLRREEAEKAVLIREEAEKARVAQAEAVLRDAKEKAEKELREKQEAEAKALKKAAQAPDKEKALAFAQTIKTLKVPEMKSDAGKAFQQVVEQQMVKFAEWLVTAAIQKL